MLLRTAVRIPLTILLASALVLTIGCSFNDVEVEDDTTEGDLEPVLLVDHTGKEWDITSAVHKYGFEVKFFEFGAGPFAIPPLIGGKLLRPKTPGYPAADESFRVIGIATNVDERAYSIEELAEYEVADQFIGDAPVAVAYWPLVDLAAVYSREIDGSILTISASGWTYKRLFVLYDYETESIWYDMSDGRGLKCVAGTYEGRRLPELQSFAGPWNVWKADHPRTLFFTEQLGEPGG